MAVDNLKSSVNLGHQEVVGNTNQTMHVPFGWRYERIGRTSRIYVSNKVTPVSKYLVIGLFKLPGK